MQIGLEASLLTTVPPQVINIVSIMITVPVDIIIAVVISIVAAIIVIVVPLNLD